MKNAPERFYSEPFASLRAGSSFVILSPSLVILSEAKNLRIFTSREAFSATCYNS